MAAELTQLRVRNDISRGSSRASSVFDRHEAARRWPLFLKCCHLTQGSMRSTRALRSRAWLEQHTDEVRVRVRVRARVRVRVRVRVRFRVRVRVRVS